MDEFEKNRENCVEFISNEHFCTVSFTNRKHISRIKKLYSERKDEFKNYIENKDGSICAKIPLKWVKINPGSLPGTRKGREMTDEEKKQLVERLREGKRNSE